MDETKGTEAYKILEKATESTDDEDFSEAIIVEEASESDINLLNLIAEIVVENIVKRIRNGRNRLYQDK